MCLYRPYYGPIPGVPLSTKGRDPGNFNNWITGSYLTEKLISPLLPVFTVGKDLAMGHPECNSYLCCPIVKLETWNQPNPRPCYNAQCLLAYLIVNLYRRLCSSVSIVTVLYTGRLGNLSSILGRGRVVVLYNIK